MNYKKIHDSIIKRAQLRSLSKAVYTENHHILPRYENGNDNGETVALTFKEHRVVHKLRYKMTGVIGNLHAYNLMKYGEDARIKNASLAAISSHRKGLLDPDSYRIKQQNAGKSGGNKARDNNLGFYTLSDEEKKAARTKGAQTIVENKIGMFSDEYRQIHKVKMKKEIEIDGMIFQSCSEAASHFNVSAGSISYWISKGKATIISEGQFSHKGRKS